MFELDSNSESRLCDELHLRPDRPAIAVRRIGHLDPRTVRRKATNPAMHGLTDRRPCDAQSTRRAHAKSSADRLLRREIAEVTGRELEATAKYSNNSINFSKSPLKFCNSILESLKIGQFQKQAHKNRLRSRQSESGSTFRSGRRNAQPTQVI